MSDEKVRKVYDNGHCKVFVSLLPDIDEQLIEDAGCDPDNPKRYRQFFPFAVVRVIATEREKSIFRSVIHKGQLEIKKKTGPFWNRKMVVVSKTTQEERLEKMILVAIKEADRHLEEYKEGIASGHESLEKIKHDIDALREVGLIARSNETSD